MNRANEYYTWQSYKDAVLLAGEEKCATLRDSFWRFVGIWQFSEIPIVSHSAEFDSSLFTQHGVLQAQHLSVQASIVI